MFNFLKLIGWIIAWPFLVVIILLRAYSCYLAGKRYRKDNTVATPEERYQKVYKLVCAFLYWKRVKIEIDPSTKIANKPMLFVANHKSNVDALVIFKTAYEQQIPYLSFIGKVELRDTFAGYIGSLIDTIFIDRQEIRQLPEIINQTVESLQNKRSVCVCLEGTRVYDNDTLGKFHAPILEAAYRTHSSIQPVVLVNTLGIMDKNHKRPNSHPVKVIYMPHITAHRFINIDRNIFVEQLRSDMLNVYLKEKQ